MFNFNYKEIIGPDHRLSEDNIYILRNGKRKERRENNWHETEYVLQAKLDTCMPLDST